MNELTIALICLAITLSIPISIEIIKSIAKHCAKKKGTKIDMKKLEYPISAFSMILAFSLVLVFLRYGANMTDWALICKYSASYGMAVNTLYLFVVQLTRKGFNGMWQGIVKLINKLKSSKDPIGDAPKLVEQSTDDILDVDVDKAFDDIINGNNK